MANYRVRATLPYTTGLSSDVAVNNWEIECDAGDLAACLAVLADFYIAHPTGQSESVSRYLSELVSRANLACRLDAYDHALPPGDPPTASRNFTLEAAAGGLNLPEEVALCFSFHGDLVEAGAVKARRRGRIYLGPLNATATQEIPSPNGVCRPADQLVNVLLAAGDDLMIEMAAAGGSWQVWSTVDATGYTIEGGWVDNAFDTMRSRGPGPTARFAF